MQNHNSVNTTEFVSLDGSGTGWRCGNCGWQNSCGSCCGHCGWSCNGGCGYNAGCIRGNGDSVQRNGSVCTATKPCSRASQSDVTCAAGAACAAGATCAANTANTSARACEACPPEKRPQQVWPCPSNTELRTGCNTCTRQTCTTASCGNSSTCQPRNTKASCNCKQPCGACQTQPSCAGSACKPACDDCQTWSNCANCPYRDTCAAYQNSGAACACKNDTASTATAAEKARNRAAGMVYAARQKLDQVFSSESALRTGTLFPELHKPMNGYCPGDCNCATPAQEAAFAAWELRLYLDTHPDDEEALDLFRQLCRETDDPNYATTFLPDECPEAWDWTEDPWPWSCRDCGE